jgi:hypothetical protein
MGAKQHIQFSIFKASLGPRFAQQIVDEAGKARCALVWASAARTRLPQIQAAAQRDKPPVAQLQAAVVLGHRQHDAQPYAVASQLSVQRLERGALRLLAGNDGAHLDLGCGAHLDKQRHQRTQVAQLLARPQIWAERASQSRRHPNRSPPTAHLLDQPHASGALQVGPEQLPRRPACRAMLDSHAAPVRACLVLAARCQWVVGLLAIAVATGPKTITAATAAAAVADRLAKRTGRFTQASAGLLLCSSLMAELARTPQSAESLGKVPAQMCFAGQRCGLRNRVVRLVQVTLGCDMRGTSRGLRAIVLPHPATLSRWLRSASSGLRDTTPGSSRPRGLALRAPVHPRASASRRLRHTSGGTPSPSRVSRSSALVSPAAIAAGSTTLTRSNVAAALRSHPLVHRHVGAAAAHIIHPVLRSRRRAGGTRRASVPFLCARFNRALLWRRPDRGWLLLLLLWRAL